MKLLQRCLYKKYGFFVPLTYSQGKEHEFWRLLKVIIKGVAIQSRIGERKGKDEKVYPLRRIIQVERKSC